MLKGKTNTFKKLTQRLFSFVAYNVKYVMLSSWKKKKKNEPQFILGDPERYKRYREEWEKANN